MKTICIVGLVVAVMGCGSAAGAGSAQGGGPAPQGPSPDVEVWEGSGTSMAVQGDAPTSFTVLVTRKHTSSSTVRTEGKVTLEGGRELSFWQDTEDHGASGFSLTTDRGTGGGRCFQNGMCQTYEANGNHAFATTLTKDGTDKLRMLTTELDGCKAVRFTQQALTRKP